MTAVTTVAMLPLLVMILATTLELGALRVVAMRVHSAADLAVLVAVNDQDGEVLARTGRLELAEDAATVARAVFAENLDGVASQLAASPREIAADADVQVDRANATVRITATVPVRTPLFGMLFFRPVTQVALRTMGGDR